MKDRTHDAPRLKQLVRVVRRRHGALEQQVALVPHVTLISQQRALPAARSLLALFEESVPAMCNYNCAAYGMSITESADGTLL